MCVCVTIITREKETLNLRVGGFGGIRRRVGGAGERERGGTDITLFQPET